MDKIKFHIYWKFLYMNFLGIIENFTMSNFHNNQNIHNNFSENLYSCNWCYLEPLGCKERAKLLKRKRKRKNDTNHFKARGRERLPIWCNRVEEIAYSELSTEEKVEIILMQRVAYILEKQQNSNIFGIHNHISKSR